MARGRRIPTVDVFAGPGGLGEGFASFGAEPGGYGLFKPALSIEMDEHAHQTLRLRAFYRQFPLGDAPDAFYECLRGEISVEDLFEQYPVQAGEARDEAWRQTLGERHSARRVRARIDERIGKTARDWVLLGGPPCQPFSMAGRARNRKGTRYSEGKETRHELYLEYLQIIADHKPAVFVMENVRGLMSARYNGVDMLGRILQDLQAPYTTLRKMGKKRDLPPRAPSVKYRLYPLAPREDAEPGLFGHTDYLVQCEQFGVPQARHRLIILGVREDIGREPGMLEPMEPIPLRKVIDGLPKLRSGLSKSDSDESWQFAITAIANTPWYRKLKREDAEVAERVATAAAKAETHARTGRGGNWCPCRAKAKFEPSWFLDPRMDGVCNHQTRQHMESDLHRYMFAACFAIVHKRSPAIKDFPDALLPDHRSVQKALKGGNFADRFRVQVWQKPATTIVSHIAKDGHYYIHPDPMQCRALTVREAARIQTFPDNYFFLGNRTQQYTQVGNAVPPLLARQIAGIVAELLA